MKKMRTTLAILASLAVISCSVPLNENVTNQVGPVITSSSNQIRGTVTFPEKNFLTKATISQIGDRAVVSLLLPPDDPSTPDKTVATGLTDASGNFVINVNFTPVVDKVYLLEVAKRIGGTGNQLISLRSYIKFSGTSWNSITTPSININSKTTAVTITDYYESSISANDTIGTIIDGTVNNIGSVSAATITAVADMVSFTFTNDRDPLRFISYQNSKYFINKETSHNKSFLLTNKYCPNCDLQSEDFSTIDLSSSDLTNSNLSKANFSSANLVSANLNNANLSSANLSSANLSSANLNNANLSSANLSSANLSSANLSSANLSSANFGNANLSNASLTGATLTNADLRGATWTNGVTVCNSFSIGRCSFPELLVNTYTTGAQKTSAVAMDADGDFVVVWQSAQDGGGDGIYAQRYTSAGAEVGGEFRVNTYTTGVQGNPSVAMDSDGDFVVAWESSAQDYSLYGIFAQRYTSTGSVSGSEFRVNNYTVGNQKEASVAMDDSGNFVISWQSNNQDFSGYGIYAQRYASDGSVSVSEFKVNSYTTGAQKSPAAAMDSTGSFVISWQSNSQDGNGYGIYAQRYTSDGSFTGSEFRVNTFTSGAQSRPVVSVDDDGDFVIAWQSNNQEASLSNYGVYAKRYASSGSVVGSEFRVNTYTTGAQNNPVIALDADGDFVITWQSNGQDGSSGGIYAQRYTSGGSVIGSEFLLNSYTSSAQAFPALAIDSTGDFVVIWQSNAQDGNGYGIYHKRYNSSGEEI